MTHAAVTFKSDAPNALGVQLRAAVEAGNYERSKALILKGAEVNLRSAQLHSTPLHVAAWKADERLVALLLRHGADPNAKAPESPKSTPTHFTAQCGSAYSMGQMIECGADVTMRNRLGDTPMHCAAYIGAARVPNLVTLLDAGADPNILNEKQQDVLAVAVARGHGDVVGAVLEHYAALPQRDDFSGISKADLLAPDARGFCLLDAPQTWHRFDEVRDALAASGQKLTKSDLLQKGIEGKTWIERAAECRALPAVLLALGDQDEGLTLKDVLDGNQKGNDLLRTLVETATLPHLMSANHWHDSTAALRKCYDILPEKGKALVQGLHQMIVKIERDGRVHHDASESAAR